MNEPIPTDAIDRRINQRAEATKQSAFVSLAPKDLTITKQSAFVNFFAPDLRVTKQSVFVTFNPPPPETRRRGSAMMIG